MIDPKQIPDEAVKAAAKEIASTCRCEMACDWRDHLEDARAAIAAAINAWPNVCFEDPAPGGSVAGFILPLPQKPEGRIDQEGDA